MGYRTPWDIYKDEPQYPAAELQAGYQKPAPVSAPALPVLPNVMRNSGQTREATSNAANTTEGKQTIQKWADENAMRAENAAVMRLPQVQEQQAQLAQNRELMRQSMMQPPRADLATPLANVSDYLQTGQVGNRKPMGPTMQDHAKEIREWAKQNQDDQRDLSKTILSGASAYKSGQTSDMWNQVLKNQLEAKNADPAAVKTGPDQEINNFAKWKRDVNSDDIMKKMPGNIDQLKIARGMLQGNSPVEAQNFKLALLKGLGVNRITDYELRNEQGGMDYMTQVQREWDKKTEGVMDATDRKNYLNLVDGLIAKSNSAYTQHFNHHIENGVINYKIPVDHAVVGINSLAEPTVANKVPRGRAPQPVAPVPQKETPDGGDPGMDAFLRSQAQ